MILVIECLFSRSTKDGQARQIRLRGRVVTSEVRIPPADPFNDGCADRKGIPAARFHCVRGIEATGRISRMSAKPQAAQLE